MVSTNFAVAALAAASIFSGAFAKPVHRRHQNVHVERRSYRVDKVVVQVYVWVDQYGNTISSSVTSRIHRETPAQAYQPSAAPSAKTTPPAPPPPPQTTLAKVTTPKKTTTPAAPQPTPEQEPEAKPSPKPVTPVASSGRIGRGIVWTPLIPGGCKDSATTQTELQRIKSEGYETIRLYGNDCGQNYPVLKFAVENGLNVILGIYNLRDFVYNGAQPFGDQLQDIISSVSKVAGETGKDVWSHVPLVGVGNEEAFKGSNPAEYQGKVTAAKTKLRALGYGGVVGTVEMWGDIKTGKAQCGQPDDAFVPVNMHTFFDPQCTAGGSGAWIAAQISSLENDEGSPCKGKKVIVIETGWPHKSEGGAGRAPDRAASRGNQQAAVNSIKNALGDYVILGAFDEPWKGGAWDTTHEKTEPWWGLF